MNITKDKTVADVVTENVGADHVFSKYNIDFCCGGGMSLDEACKTSGVTFENVKEEIEAIKNIIVGDDKQQQADLDSLIKQNQEIHHNYFVENTSLLLPLTAKVAQVHGQEHPEVIKINNLFNNVVSELGEQLSVEKNNVFPLVEKYISKDKNSEITNNTIYNSLEQSIKNSDLVFEKTTIAFKKISKLSSNYTLPNGACNSYAFLYQKLKEYEHELHKYVHFEKNIFFPKIVALQ